MSNGDRIMPDDELEANSLRADTETDSLRAERGQRAGEGNTSDVRDRMKAVPLAPHSAGVLGVGAASTDEDSVISDTVEADLREARRDVRQRLARDD